MTDLFDAPAISPALERAQELARILELPLAVALEIAEIEREETLTTGETHVDP